MENAVDHGIAPHARVGHLTVRSRRDEHRLILEVEDNGAGLAPDHALEKEGVGLSNTRARLNQLYAAAQSLELLPAPNRGLVVRVIIPWREKDETGRS